MKEEWAIILDYLPLGYPDSFKKEPIAQALGEGHFTLLELIPKKEAHLELRERVYIGKEKREKILFVKGRIPYEKLTNTARRELEAVVEELVKKNESKYVDFFNRAGAVTIRLHSLELLPSIGKKHMWDIIEEREKKPFESFEDIKKRIHLMPDPVKVVTERILHELKGGDKYYLFVRPPRRERHT